MSDLFAAVVAADQPPELTIEQLVLVGSRAAQQFELHARCRHKHGLVVTLGMRMSRTTLLELGMLVAGALKLDPSSDP